MNPKLILSAARVMRTAEKIDLQWVEGDEFKEQIPGGKARKKGIEDFNFFSLLKGLIVELEHTDDPVLAMEIAMDHLEESDSYYDYLENMEKQMETDGAMQTAA